MRYKSLAKLNSNDLQLAEYTFPTRRADKLRRRKRHINYTAQRASTISQQEYNIVGQLTQLTQLTPNRRLGYPTKTMLIWWLKQSPR